MSQAERLLYLIQYLLHEKIRPLEAEIPDDEEGQRRLLRALMNVRPPLPVSDEFLNVQDEYLEERSKERGIVEEGSLPPVSGDDRIVLWQGDITTLGCDAIVNACNAQMLGCFQPLHGCIDNIIHTYAGIQLRLEMNRIMEKQGHEEPTGRAKITGGYNLPARHILHTVGPIVQGELTDEHEELLASCYDSCLTLAMEKGLESVAFCCISTGVFALPNQRAAEIAVDRVQHFLNEKDAPRRVIFNVYQDRDLQIYRELLQ